MKCKKQLTISLKVYPAVFRYLENNFPKNVQGVYDLLDSPYYCLISSMLSRSTIKTPSLVPMSYSRFVPIKTYITEFDFYHYGWEINERQQYNLSKTILHVILQNACHEIAVAHVCMNISRDRAIRNFIYENLFEDDELSYSYLIKYYQRNYLENEKKLKEYVSNLIEKDA